MYYPCDRREDELVLNANIAEITYFLNFLKQLDQLKGHKKIRLYVPHMQLVCEQSEFKIYI